MGNAYMTLKMGKHAINAGEMILLAFVIIDASHCAFSIYLYSFVC